MENEQLRAKRELRGWSQEDLVRELVALGIELGERQLGVTRAQVSRWEHGINHPRAPYPKLLCQLFNATADELGLVPASRSASASITMEGTTIEDGGDDVERRDFLRVAGTAAVGAVLPWRAWPAFPDGSLDDLIPITAHYRRLWSTVPSSTLLDAVLAHLRILRQLIEPARSEATRARVAAAVNEAAAFAGRLAFDLGDYSAFDRYYQLATWYAKGAGDDTLAAYTLGNMGFQSVLRGDGERAVGLVEEAKGLMPSAAPPVVQSWFAVYEAGACSRVGDTRTMQALLARAEEATSKDQEPWAWTVPLSPRRFTRYIGFCATNVRLPALSIPTLKQGLQELGPAPSRWRAISLSCLAESYILTGEIEEACGRAGEAFDIGSQLGSYRVLQRVREVRSCLNPYRDVAAVRDLDERMAGALGAHT